MKKISRDKLVLYIVILIMGALVFVVSQEKQSKPTDLLKNQSGYEKDVVDEVNEVYITIFPPDQRSKKYAYTFQELNGAIDEKGEDVAVKILFQEGKEGEPRKGYYGYGLTDTNGVMKLRGQSSRLAQQKSYKIELNSKAGLWQGYKVINLNKHPSDSLKIRNKLSFDYLKQVSGITSLRTNFVQVYIKDYSQGDFTQEYQDYGLFTNVENPDQDFLKNRGLDPNGQLYKVENFEFFRYPEQLKLTTDEDYREENFEEVLEIKGDTDHRKLIRMLEDVNNQFMHINDVIAKHFDRENYITWLAINILWGNIDTASRNFFLYSPSDSDTWYFLPWDFDKAWGAYKFPAAWQEGVSNYWANALHRRFLKNRANLNQLTQKVESLAKVFTPQNTKKLIELYQPIVTSYLTKNPDNQYKQNTLEEINKEIKDLPKFVEENRQKYYRNLEKPMPVFMGNPINLGKYYIFRWSDSYDFQGDSISYKLEISDTPSFEKTFFRLDEIKENQCVISDLPVGRYYWRLEIKDTKGNKQIPFDIFIDKSNQYYFGVQEFYISSK